MKGSTIKEHIASDSPSAAYTARGKVSGLDAPERWECEEYTIHVALGNSMPDEAFSLIKETELVKDTWAILKSTYKDRMATLVSDYMRAFQDTKCPEGENIRAHFHLLTLLRD
jgi:hypothetical protein